MELELAGREGGLAREPIFKIRRVEAGRRGGSQVPYPLARRAGASGCAQAGRARRACRGSTVVARRATHFAASPAATLTAATADGAVRDQIAARRHQKKNEETKRERHEAQDERSAQAHEGETDGGRKGRERKEEGGRREGSEGGKRRKEEGREGRKKGRTEEGNE